MDPEAVAVEAQDQVVEEAVVVRATSATSPATGPKTAPIPAQVEVLQVAVVEVVSAEVGEEDPEALLVESEGEATAVVMIMMAAAVPASRGNAAYADRRAIPREPAQVRCDYNHSLNAR